MKNTIVEKIEDTFIDHPTHYEYRKDCSSCWTENLIVKQWARNEKIRNGISRNRFSDEQISPNPFER